MTTTALTTDDARSRSTPSTSCRPTAASRSPSSAARAAGCGTTRAGATWTSSSGLAVTSLGHAHPVVAEPLSAQAARCCTSPTCTAPTCSPGGRHPRPAARRGRPRVLLQLGRRGQRVRHQAGPRQERRRPRPPRRRHRLRLVPRPHPGHARRDRPAAKHEPFQPLPEGFRHVALATSTPSPRRIDHAGRRRAARAGPGRGRRPPGRRPGTSRAVRRLCDERGRPADHRRGPDRARPDRPVVRLPARPACGPTWSRSPRPSATACRSAPAGPAPTSATPSGPGDHATTFGGQPLARRRPRSTVLDVMEAEDVPARGRRGPAPA